MSILKVIIKMLHTIIIGNYSEYNLGVVLAVLKWLYANKILNTRSISISLQMKLSTYIG